MTACHPSATKTAHPDDAPLRRQAGRCEPRPMRVLACALLLAGCAAADPGYGPASPTRAGAPVAATPPVAAALEDDPAPAPDGSEDEGHHGHHAHPPTSGHSAGGADEQEIDPREHGHD